MSGYEVSFTCEAEPGALDRLFVVVDAGAVGAERTKVVIYARRGDIIHVVDSSSIKFDFSWRRRQIRRRVAARKRRRGW